MFKPKDYVPHWNTKVPYDISVITDPLMNFFPKESADSLMSHSISSYEDIRVDNKGACLNFNSLGLCGDTHCYYRYTKANLTRKRIKSVKINIE